MDYSEKSNIAEKLAKRYLNETLAQKLFIFLLMISVFFGLITFLYYNSIKRVETLLSENVGLYNDTELTIPSTSVFTDNTLKESYILYLNIDNMSGSGLFFSDFGISKSILRRADNKFHINYNPEKNCIHLVFQVQHLDVIQEMNSEQKLDLHPRTEIIEIKNIPYHSWFQLVVTINNRDINVFINKLLVRSATLSNVPELSNDSILLGRKNNNPNMFIGRLEYSPDVVSISDINALYFRNMRFLKLTTRERNKVQTDGYNKLHKETEAIDSLHKKANINIQGCYLESDIKPFLTNTKQISSIKNCSEANLDSNFIGLGNKNCYGVSNHNVEKIKTAIPIVDDERCMSDGEVKYGSEKYIYVSKIDKE